MIWWGRWAVPDGSSTAFPLFWQSTDLSWIFLNKLVICTVEHQLNAQFLLKSFLCLGFSDLSPCCPQVELPPSWRASLVSWVQGMQIGLPRVPKTDMKRKYFWIICGYKSTCEPERLSPRSTWDVDVRLQVEESHVVVVVLPHSRRCFSINVEAGVDDHFFYFFAWRTKSP